MLLPIELQFCSHCGDKVPRRFCHRDRGGAYICHPCRAKRQGRGWLVIALIRTRMVLPAVGRRAALALAGLLGVALVVATLILIAVD